MLDFCFCRVYGEEGRNDNIRRILAIVLSIAFLAIGRLLLRLPVLVILWLLTISLLRGVRFLLRGIPLLLRRILSILRLLAVALIVWVLTLRGVTALVIATIGLVLVVLVIVRAGHCCLFGVRN